MSWAVPDLELTSWTTQVLVQNSTTSPAHLWLRWATLPLHSERRSRTVRGILEYCGLTYHFPPDFITEQIEAGETTRHTFYVSPLDCGTRYAYILIESATEYLAIPTLGPLTLATLPCLLSPEEEIVAHFAPPNPNHNRLFLASGLSASFTFVIT